MYILEMLDRIFVLDRLHHAVDIIEQLTEEVDGLAEWRIFDMDDKIIDRGVVCTDLPS